MSVLERIGRGSRIIAVGARSRLREKKVDTDSLPDAAASLREGLEETLTVIKLGVPGVLRRSLATTNPIESAPSVTRRVTARVTRWRDGDMRSRWCVAGLLSREQVPSTEGPPRDANPSQGSGGDCPRSTDWNRA
jgi:hypothetical protein